MTSIRVPLALYPLVIILLYGIVGHFEYQAERRHECYSAGKDYSSRDDRCIPRQRKEVRNAAPNQSR